MNEYRWYPEDDRKKEYAIIPYTPPVKKRRNPIFVVVLTSLITCFVCMSIFLFVVVPRLQKTTIINHVGDERDKSGFGDVVSVGKEGAMSVAKINKAVGPSVVGISGQTKLGGFLNQTVDLGSGSGVIVSADGYIITNNHVIQDASKLKVILNTQQEYDAAVVGADVRTDIAILKIDAPDLVPVSLGDSSMLEVGDLAVAIGNPLGQELAGSVTAGVVSALNRTITVDGKRFNLIQTDAAINPGNSGGALVNCFGELIGINTVKLSSTEVEGIGFAIPINEIKPIMNELISSGRVSGRPIIGLTGTDAPYGVVVVSVIEGMPAQKAGIKEGDLIVKVNDKPVTTIQEVNLIRDEFKPGDTLAVTIYRDNELQTVNIVLEEDMQ